MTFRKGDCLLCRKTGTLPDGSVCWACNGTGKYRKEIMYPHRWQCPICGYITTQTRKPDRKRCPKCRKLLKQKGDIDGTD